MAIRMIFQEGEEVLRKVSKPVSDFDVKLGRLLDDMWDTLNKAVGAGLAAPQVGILRRVAIVDADDVKLELVNPRIVKKEGTQVGPEGCLSVSGKKNCDVERAMKVSVEAFDRNGKKFSAEAEGFAARAVQHELDHLDGILFIDKAKKK